MDMWGVQEQFEQHINARPRQQYVPHPPPLPTLLIGSSNTYPPPPPITCPRLCCVLTLMKVLSTLSCQARTKAITPCVGTVSTAYDTVGWMVLWGFSASRMTSTTKPDMPSHSLSAAAAALLCCSRCSQDLQIAPDSKAHAVGYSNRPHLTANLRKCTSADFAFFPDYVAAAAAGAN